MFMGGSGEVKETAEQAAQQDINQKMWDYYQKDFAPSLDKYIASRMDPNTTKEEKNKVAGEVNADVMKAVKPQSATNPVVNAKKLMTAADVKSDAETKGKMGVDAKQIGTEENIINIGKGQTTKAMAGLDELASMSVQSAIQDKEREEELSGIQENAMGSLIGAEAGIAAYGVKSKKPKTLDDELTNYAGDQMDEKLMGK